MRIAVAQIDSTVADFRGNADKIVSFAERALRDFRADLVLFPELALCGYPPMDLLDQDSFVEESVRALRSLQRRLPAGLAVGVGYVARSASAAGKALVNTYGLLLDGEVAFQQDKTLLPTYDVFDEARYFEPASERKVFPYKGERLGFAICEDMWRETETPGTRYAADPVRDLLDRGATLLCVPSASPYYADKLKLRRRLACRIARRASIPIVYQNAVGANDSIVFDGRSFVVAPASDASEAETRGDVILRAAAGAFAEEILYWDSSTEQQDLGTGSVQGENELDVIENALVLGIRGYMEKCGFKRAHLGLSGGIDSALVAHLAVRAIGAQNVRCFGLPSRFSSPGSVEDARELAAKLGTPFDLLGIEDAFAAYLGTLAPLFGDKPFDLAEENLQARIRGTLLMAYSNKFDSMLLTTGNKSELAMGYCTLYGDMSGGLAPIGDLFKVEVFALCHRINERAAAAGARPPIPEAILAKPPSAELRPDQTDQDSLPPYEDLDEVLRLYLIENLSRSEIMDRGWDGALATRIIRAVAKAEYKRRQAPPVIKVSPRAFGMGRRMPIARHAYEG